MASDGVPANVPPGMPSISTDSRTESDFLTGTPTAATVEPMTWPARSRSTVHESGSCTELTVNVTRSAGVPCVPLTGFLGRTAAETEVTVATGLPAVVTDIASNREWITENENGWLAPTGASEEFAEKLLRVASLPPNELEAISSRNQRIVAERADWDKNFPSLLRLYEGLVSTAMVMKA